MSKHITQKDVAYIANLSRIFLREEERLPLAKDLEKIIGYVKKLEKLDVKNIDPTTHVLPLKNIFRADQVKPSLTQEATLEISIEKMDGSFKVPKIIE